MGSRPPGTNLSEGERIVYGDQALALKLSGRSYEEIAQEIGVHRNSIGNLIRDAARRRSTDRDIVEEINRGIAIQRQLVEDLWKDYRSTRPGTDRRQKFATLIVKTQMSLLFLSGVEVPDPEKVIRDSLKEMDLPMPDLMEYVRGTAPASLSNLDKDEPSIIEDQRTRPEPEAAQDDGDYLVEHWEDGLDSYYGDDESY